MVRVTRRDHECLQEGLRELYAHHNLDTLPRVAVRVATQLVGSDVGAYNEIDPHRRRIVGVVDPVEAESRILELAHLWERHMHQHPVLAHYLQHPADGPRKISDFLTLEQFHQLDLYREFYGLLGLNYQMVVAMPAPKPLTVGIALNRADQDFDEHDRAVLKLLQPHLRQAYDNAVLIHDLSIQLDWVNHALDRIAHGLIVIDDSGRVIQASPAAHRYVARHFGGSGLAGALPEDLWRWARAQLQALRQKRDDMSPPSPWIMDHEGGRLVIRLVADHHPRRFMLIMHTAARLTDPRPLQDLGLTAREAEVLFHVIGGQSNAQIGHILKISERTAHKHLENVYRKLDVSGRAAAVTKALEWLRL